ncbi:elongation factor EF-1 beta subunit [Pyronema omphalodes]|nr:elongation factor EF-1 beta subunit [Pyronema omphalodes]
MGFTDLTAASGLAALNSWLETRSYIVGFVPSQADVTIFNAVGASPDKATYPNIARWYKNIASFEAEFETLAGEKSTDISKYGPEVVEEAAPAAAPAAEEDDDEVDLFGSDDEEDDAEKEALTAKRLAEYHAKKAQKPKTIAKSIVTLDVKPWDDETNMDELIANVRAIEQDGLVWGGHTLIPVGYGIKKLQINLVVEDEKVSLDELQQRIEEDEDHVQSTDIAAMQKI